MQKYKKKIICKGFYVKKKRQRCEFVPSAVELFSGMLTFQLSNPVG